MKPCRHPATDPDCLLCWLAENRRDAQRKWGLPETAPDGPTRVPDRLRRGVAPPPPPGPGAELKALLLSLGLTPKGCACDARARRMDAGGVEWCRDHRDEIAGWLRAEAARRGWGDVFAAAVRAVASGLAFRLDPTDVYGSLVDLAIERAAAEK